MSFSIYKSPATLAKESRENRARQMQEEVERRDRMRQSVGQNSARSTRAQEVRGIEEAKAQYQREFAEYYQHMRSTILEQPDPDGFFDAGPALDTDPAVERDIHWNLFLKDHPDFYNSEENRTTFTRYLQVNNCTRYDRWVLSAMYKRLLSLGLLETGESQEPTVQVHEVPVTAQSQLPGEPLRWDDEGPIFSVHTYNFDSKCSKRDDRIEGRNPETGQAWMCTKREIDRMDSDAFKGFASITKVAQSLHGIRSNYGNKFSL